MFNTYDGRKLFSVIRPAFLSIFVILLLILTWTCFETFLLYLLRDIVNTVTTNPTHATEWLFYFMTFAIIIFFVEIPMRVASFIQTKALPRVSLLLRKNLIKLLLSKDILFFNSEKIGNLVSRIIELPQAIDNIIKVTLYGIIAGSFSFFVTIVLIAFNLGYLAVYFLLWYVLMMTTGIYFIKGTINLSQKYAHWINLSNAEITELLQNIFNIKVAGKEQYEESRINKFFLSTFQSQNKLEMLSFKIDTLRSIISAVLLLGLFAIVSTKIHQQNASIGDLVFVISSAFIARRDIWRVSLQLTELYKDFGFIKEVGVLIASKQPSDKAKQNDISKINSIKIDNVSFGFQNDASILRNINLEIKAGTKVAFIGSSGAGKTTLAKILQGIYQIKNGKVLLNNTNQNNFNPHSIFEHVAYISQEPILFNRTIKDNITYLNNKIDAKKLHEVAKVALCHDFIQSMPEQYDTPLINLGSNLSAGQKQRVAIARALYSKAEWIIFDEPSSALDIITEMKLVKNLLSYCKDRTLIIITHNPRILELMDKIYFLQNGQILSEGTHKGLVKKSKAYREYVNG